MTLNKQTNKQKNEPDSKKQKCSQTSKLGTGGKGGTHHFQTSSKKVLREKRYLLSCTIMPIFITSEDIWKLQT